MIKRFSSFFSAFGLLWFLVILTLAAYDTRGLFIEKKVQFDLMALLPESKTEALKVASQLMEEANVLGRVLILVGHPDPAASQSAFELLQQKLKQVSMPLKEQTSETLVQEYKNLFKKLHPYRAGLLSESDRNQLLKGKGYLLLQNALSEIMNPFSIFGPVQLKNDPFFLYPRFMASLQPLTPLQKDDKGNVFIKDNGKVWYLLKAQLSDSAFSLQAQKEIIEKLSPILEWLQNAKGVEVLKTGAIFYAAAGSTQANTEISQMGLASIFGIIFVLLLIFKTLRPLFLAITVITSGLIGGLAACFFVFGSVHILALVFGCSLVGVTVDYALHYFCASYKRDNRISVLKSLMPALPLGVLSSILGYSLLMIAPFPGIQQMSILAAFGLLSAFISVCLWGPYFIKFSEKKAPPLGKKIQIYLNNVAEYGHKKSAKFCLSLCLMALFCMGAVIFTFEDDIRSFQSLDERLKQEEERIRSMIKFDTTSKFLAIRGSTLEEVLQLEEKIQPELERMQARNEIKGYQSLATLMPSKQRQQENRQLVAKELYQKQWTSFSQAIGLANDFNPNDLGANAAFLTTLDDLPDGWRELIYVPEVRKVIGRILLQGVNNIPALEQLVSKYDSISYIDPPQEYSSLFTSYRQIMMGLVLLVLCGIGLMISVWKGLKVASIIILPVVLSLLATVGIISLLGMPFNLFHTMGLLLILCIGIDYAFFLYWRKPQANLMGEGDLLLLANGLAAITTILSFGLLAFSKTTAIHSFGLTVFVGILLSFCVTTLFLGKGKC
ncbi:MAG TPA: hypothetical protein VMW10_03640 [Alphaproteobacteria bacterium]|nr:hypothetical protein [Alphaproteobacteria bacterium]